MVSYNGIKTLEELISHCVRCYQNMRVTWPQHGNLTETLNVMDLIPKFPGRYASNNSTISFICENGFFVMPYTRAGVRILENAGFKQDYFYVPFSNWDYPTNERIFWEQLREMAQQSRKEDFITDCEEFSDKHGYGIVEQSVLDNCFEMPHNGVTVIHPCYKDTTSPAITGSFLDCTAIERLGHFTTNNGRVVFVYRNGKTYVAKGYGIVCILQNAGYKSGSLFVPFSNGEMIDNPYYRTRWENLKKF